MAASLSSVALTVRRRLVSARHGTLERFDVLGTAVLAALARAARRWLDRLWMQQTEMHFLLIDFRVLRKRAAKHAK